MTNWLTQEEARTALGVRQQTLYAYVSRGQIGVCSDPDHPRRSLYLAEDIANLVKKRERGRKHNIIAASTMSWGEPIITTAISTIAKGRLYYRGKDAVALAETASLEDAAELLWEAPSPPHFSAGRPNPSSNESPRSRAFTMLGMAAASGNPAYGRTPSSLREDAAALVGGLASAFGGIADDEVPLHQRLAAAWSRDGTSADLIRRALVLLADQELTSSAFAARVTASTGASLGACALTGLATLSGPLHGDATVRVRSLFEEVERTDADSAVCRYLASGIPIPGFGHPLYPDGDPRAAALLAAFDLPINFDRMVSKVGTLTGLRPTIDVALAALVTRCQLPADAAFALFAIGRSVGWLAHSIEQVTTGTLIRPRARYTGPPLATLD
ncbi:MAG TPA: citrate synthase [Telmatospirillum sp.]|nr:citrate synthase [Telmatospirillum sp.]